MRPLTEEETRQLFEKLYLFVGKNLKALVDRPDDPHCFRLHKQRIFYAREALVRQSSSISRDKLVCVGQSVAKFTHSGKLRLTLGSVGLLSQYCGYKVWVKGSSEMSFLYGNHVLKSGVAKITDGTPPGAGAVVMSMQDVPLGFGLIVKGANEIRTAEASSIVLLHQCDVGEYLRAEDDV